MSSPYTTSPILGRRRRRSSSPSPSSFQPSPSFSSNFRLSTTASLASTAFPNPNPNPSHSRSLSSVSAISASTPTLSSSSSLSGSQQLQAKENQQQNQNQNQQTPLPSIRTLHPFLEFPSATSASISIHRSDINSSTSPVSNAQMHPGIPIHPASGSSSTTTDLGLAGLSRRTSRAHGGIGNATAMLNPSVPTMTSYSYPPPPPPSQHPHSHSKSPPHSYSHPSHSSLYSHPHPYSQTHTLHPSHLPLPQTHSSPTIIHLSPRTNPHSTMIPNPGMGTSTSRRNSETRLGSTSAPTPTGMIEFPPLPSHPSRLHPHSPSHPDAPPLPHRPQHSHPSYPQPPSHSIPLSPLGTRDGPLGSDNDQDHEGDTDFVDSTQMMDHQPHEKKRRRRQALSCTECKRRKIKCDRNQPCLPCTKRGEQAKCQWHIVEPIDKYVTRVEYDELRARVDRLEATLSKAREGESMGSARENTSRGSGLSKLLNGPESVEDNPVKAEVVEEREIIRKNSSSGNENQRGSPEEGIVPMVERGGSEGRFEGVSGRNRNTSVGIGAVRNDSDGANTVIHGDNGVRVYKNRG